MTPSRRTSGMALVWVLLVGVIIAGITAYLLSGTRIRSVSTGVSALSASAQVQLGNLSSYSKRLLTVHASDLASSTLPNGAWDSSVNYAQLAQVAADRLFCTRFTSASGTAQLSFTGTACGAALSGASVPAASRIQRSVDGTSADLVTLPYVLTLTPPGVAAQYRRGELSFVAGTLPLSGYGLYRGGAATLGPGASVAGSAYVLGQATLAGTATITNLYVGGCTVPGLGCTGTGGVAYQAGGSVTPPMQLIPAANRPCTAQGCVAGVLNPSASSDVPLTLYVPAALLGNFTSVLLGTGPSGEQRVTLCGPSGCQLYLLDGTNVISGSTGAVVMQNSDHVFYSASSFTVAPETAGQAGVSDALTLRSGGDIRVTGDLRLVNRACASNSDCQLAGNAAPSGDVLGLAAAGDVALLTPNVDAAIWAQGDVTGYYGFGAAQSSAAALLGSVAAGGQALRLNVTQDPRFAAPYLLRVPGFPLMSSQVHLVTLTDKP